MDALHPPGPVTYESASAGPQFDVLFDREMRARFRREAFLKAGVRLLNTKGYSGLALSDVAESLGVTRGAFYYLFPDKEALLLGCLDRGWQEIDGALEHSGRHHGGGVSALESSWRRLLYSQMSGTLELIHPRMIDALGENARASQTARLEAMKSRLAGPVASRMASRSPQLQPDLRVLECLIFRMLFLSGHAFANAAGLEKWPRFQTPSQDCAQVARFLTQ
jgi:AcrR family transcriptional regulator